MRRSYTGGQTGFRIRRRQLIGAAGLCAGLSLAGCAMEEEEPDDEPEEVTVQITLENRDIVERSFAIEVSREDEVVSESEGVLQAGPDSETETSWTGELVAEEHRVTVSSEGGQRGYSWEPTECPELFVNAWIDSGDPRLDTQCQDE